MEISTTSFTDGGTIPLKYAEGACGGQNVRPALSWGGAPSGTKSFALTIYDPDAPTGSGFWHWIIADIPASVTELPTDAALPAGAREWANDYGTAGYGGPCPPPGPAHHYIVTVHALPVDHLAVPDNAPNVKARFTIFTTQLDSASVTGLFAS